MPSLPASLFNQLNNLNPATYLALTEQLIISGFRRLECDDRLLDIFPDQTREKGVELWDKWQPDTVFIIRLRLPYDHRQTKIYFLPRTKLEQTLTNHQKLNLLHFDTPGVSKWRKWDTKTI